MKTKLSCFIAVLLLTNIMAYSQSKKVTPDPRLKEVFTEKEIADRMDVAPEKIDYYNFYLSNYCSVETSAPANGVLKGDVSEIKSKPGYNWVMDSKSFDIQSFNMLKYRIPLELDKKIYYTIGNSNTFLVFISINEFSYKYKSQNITK
mgnify:CR=1 FL=1